MKLHVINISNFTPYIAKFFNGFDALFLANFFADFQNEAASLCINKSFDKDLKSTLKIL